MITQILGDWQHMRSQWVPGPFPSAPQKRDEARSHITMNHALNIMKHGNFQKVYVC